MSGVQGGRTDEIRQEIQHRIAEEDDEMRLWMEWIIR